MSASTAGCTRCPCNTGPSTGLRMRSKSLRWSKNGFPNVVVQAICWFSYPDLRRSRGSANGSSRLRLASVPLCFRSTARLPAEEQDRALRPSDRRKIILSTNVAETSLTIDGVTAVIDSGLARTVSYDGARGIDRWETNRISRASADQRAGRAGRTGPGTCIRLWSELEQRGRPQFDQPEIHRVDLSSAVLALHAWGVRDPASFDWFDPPKPERLAEAERLLVFARRLGRRSPSNHSPGASHARFARASAAGAFDHRGQGMRARSRGCGNRRPSVRKGHPANPIALARRRAQPRTPLPPATDPTSSLASTCSPRLKQPASHPRCEVAASTPPRHAGSRDCATICSRRGPRHKDDEPRGDLERRTKVCSSGFFWLTPIGSSSAEEPREPA